MVMVVVLPVRSSATPFVVWAVNFQEPVIRAVLELSAKPGPSSYLPQDVKVAEPTAKVAKPIKNSFYIIFMF